MQLKTLMGHQNHQLSEADVNKLIELTDGMSIFLFLFLFPIFPHSVSSILFLLIFKSQETARLLKLSYRLFRVRHHCARQRRGHGPT